MDNNRLLIVTDDKGNEIEMTILFTTKLEEYNRDYVFYYNPKKIDLGVYVSAYTENGELLPVENEEEWDLLNEVFEQYQEGAQNSKCSGCTGNCDENCNEGECCSNCDKDN